MASLAKVLLPEEKVLYRALPSRLPLFVDGAVLGLGLLMVIAGLFFLAMPAVGFGLLGVGGIVTLVGFGRLTRTMVHRGTTDMVITNRRVLSRSGVLRKESEEMFLGKVESVEVYQTLWGRLLGYGAVEINGSGEGELSFVGVQSPHELRKACLAAVEQAVSGRAPVVAASAVFEVRIHDQEGGEQGRWVEVRADTAEHARALAAATGVRVSEARLKRIG